VIFPQNVKDQERRTMNTDNTQDGAEPSPASVGSHGDERRSAFERWADGDGCLRTIKKKNGSYLDGPTRWAWEGWQAATLTDEERAAVDDGIDSVSGDESLSPSQRREIATSLRGLLRRLG
jgi:hypothetical protein